MELREFVKATLVQIIEGVRDARAAVSQMEARDGAEIVRSYEDQKVDFDVGVTVVESSAREGGGGVQISVLSLGAGISKEKEQTAVNHIKFTVPITLPTTQHQRSSREYPQPTSWMAR